MRLSRGLSAGLVYFVVMGSGLAVAAAAPAAAGGGAAASQPDIESLAPNTVLVRIGEVDQITQEDFERSAGGITLDQYGRTARTIVESRLLLLYAKEHPDLVTDEEVEKPIKDEMKKGKTLAQIEEGLKKRGLTLDGFRRAKRLHLIKTNLVKEGDKHLDDAAYRQRVFSADPDAFNGTEVLAHHLLISVPVYNTPEQREEKRRKLEDIRQRLMTGEINWDKALAETNGQTPNGGELGWFSRHSGVNEPLAGAAFSLKPGDLSPVVQSGLGFHIVQVLERRPGTQTSDDPRTLQKLREWIEQEPLYEAITQTEKKHPLLGVHAPARTAYMAAHEFHRPPPMKFGGAPPAPPASRPAKKAS